MEVCGEAENRLASELMKHELQIEKDVLDPLSQLAEVRRLVAPNLPWLVYRFLSGSHPNPDPSLHWSLPVLFCSLRSGRPFVPRGTQMLLPTPTPQSEISLNVPKHSLLFLFHKQGKP